VWQLGKQQLVWPRRPSSLLMLHHFGRRSLSLTAGELASVAVVGVGGVGGPVAAALATAGKADVTVVARGETRKKLRKAGLVVELTSRGVVEDSVHVRCSSSSTSEHQQPQHQPPTFRVADAREEELSQAVGEQDFVVLCMKQGDQLRDAAKLAQPLLGPSTTVVTLQNGLPFWYFAGCASHEYLPRLQRLQSADPDGSLSAMLPPDSILGGAVYISGTRRRGDSSGNGAVVVDNNQHGSNVLVIGDATGAAAAVAEKGQEREQQPAASQRARSFRGLFAGGKPVIDVQLVAGPEATRNAVWDKLVANLSYNCLSGALSVELS
jgi:ketopantoate reductase